MPRLAPFRHIALIAVGIAAIVIALPASAQDPAHRNKTRRSLSTGLMQCIVAYELTNQASKVPPLADAFERYNNNTPDYFTKYHASAREVLGANEAFMSRVDSEARVCDMLAPEQIDLGDTMRLDVWREGDALQ